MPETFLRLPTVQARVGLSRSGIYRLIQLGKFPSPIKLTGARASAWTASSIDRWIAERIQAAHTQGDAV